MKVKSLSHVQLFATTLTVTYQAPPSMGFSRQEHWSGLPFPSPGDLPVSTMIAISIAVAIPFIPSHRISRKKVERGLLYSFTRKQFEMQEVSELSVVTLLARYNTVYLSSS